MAVREYLSPSQESRQTMCVLAAIWPHSMAAIRLLWALSVCSWVKRPVLPGLSAAWAELSQCWEQEPACPSLASSCRHILQVVS